MSRLRLLPLCSLLLLAAAPLAAQDAPALGYMHPAGGLPGQTIEVTLGGYEWTPDMQVFVHEPGFTLEVIAPPGPVIVPEPPYWFGKKARRSPDPLPRETRARLTIPAGCRPGIYHWQAANVNGATTTGRFVVGEASEVMEVDGRKGPQPLISLPVTINGQVKLVEQVDQYHFTVPKAGPVTCSVAARAFGSKLNAILEIRDAAGQLVADAADTAGNDTALTFTAAAGASYVAALYDVDYRGDRALTYRLTITPGPRIVATIPAAGRRGETRPVEIIGYGLATGAAQLESVTQNVTFPSDAAETFAYRLETPFGTTPTVELRLSDLAETVENPAVREAAVPLAVTGVLDQLYGEDRYILTGKMGEVWQIDLYAHRLGSPLDVSLFIAGMDGKELARHEDLPGTTDASLLFTLPADGSYHVGVSDTSGRSGNRAATYRLVVAPPAAGFTITMPERLLLPSGGKVPLPVTVTRTGGFNDPINITLTGLPAGVTVPPMLTIPAGQAALPVELTAAADAAATASLVFVSAEGTVGGQVMRRTATPTLVAMTLKPPFTIDAEGMDDVTKWPRGTTFPAPVLIYRNEGFNGEIMLEMTSQQGRVVQGICGPELAVPPGVARILYPVFLPEWLETTRTSRMVVNGVAKIPDAKGNIRYTLTKQKTRMGFLPVGALLKLSAEAVEYEVEPGAKISVPLAISRTQQLTVPLKIEILSNADTAEWFIGEAVNVTPDQTRLDLPVTLGPAAVAGEERELTIRATGLQDGHLPVISETKVVVMVRRPAQP